MMSLGVGNFMSDDAGEFVGGCRPLDQSGVDIDRSTGNGEGIELRIFDDEKTIIERLRAGGGKNAPSNPINVTFDFGIVNELKKFFCFAAEFPTDFRFFVFART